MILCRQCKYFCIVQGKKSVESSAVHLVDHIKNTHHLPNTFRLSKESVNYNKVKQ